MKRLTILALALCLALAYGVPAMALDADFSGEFRVRGFSSDNIGLNDPKDASSAYYDTRTRIKSVFKISDAISFTTQFDALERTFGTSQTSTTVTTTAAGSTVERKNYDDNIDFQHAYATIKTPVGGLLVGRLIGSQWGPSGMGDSNDDGKDRILLFVPIENWTFVAYAEKYAEQDNNTVTSDEDLDKYTALVKYKGENFEAGFLQTNYRYKNFPAMRDLLAYKGVYNNYSTLASAATTARGIYTGSYATLQNLGVPQTLIDADITTPGATLGGVTSGAFTNDLYALNNAAIAAEGNATLAGQQLLAGPTYVDATVWAANPYVKFDFGPFSAFGEFLYGWGSADVKTAGRNDMDMDVTAYHVEGKYNFGPGYVRGGYWTETGDNDTTDDELNAVGYIEPNKDLDIAFILTGTDEYANAGLQDTLGGLGNFSGNAQSLDGRVGTTATAGAKLIYAAVGFSPMENLDLEVLYANAKADAPPGKKTWDPVTNALYANDWSDDIGDEYDFKATWTPMENLEYKFVAAFLDAGEYWKMGNTANKIDDNLTLYNALTISF